MLSNGALRISNSRRYRLGTKYETFNFTEGQGGEFRAARWSDAAPRACDTWRGRLPPSNPVMVSFVLEQLIALFLLFGVSYDVWFTQSRVLRAHAVYIQSQKSDIFAVP